MGKRELGRLLEREREMGEWVNGKWRKAGKGEREGKRKKKWSEVKRSKGE